MEAAAISPQMEAAAKLGYMKLKRWLVELGVPKSKVDACPGKPSLLHLYRQWSEHNTGQTPAPSSPPAVLPPPSSQRVAPAPSPQPLSRPPPPPPPVSGFSQNQSVTPVTESVPAASEACPRGDRAQLAAKLWAVYSSQRTAFPAWAKEPTALAGLDWTSACVYHDPAADPEAVRLIATRREPVNIAMRRKYSKPGLQALAGYSEGGYGLSTPDRLMPNIAIYCATPVVDPKDSRRRLESVHVINLIGFAFDSAKQPDAQHFGGALVRRPLQEEKLFAAYVTVWSFAFAAAVDHGLGRLQAFGVGSDAFRPRHEYSKQDFHQRFVVEAIEAAQAAVAGANSVEVLLGNQFRIPDSLFGQSSRELSDTLYVNAWDPWSMVGNGNASDNSLDGYWGRSTAMAVLCWPVTNPDIQYRPLGPPPSSEPLPPAELARRLSADLERLAEQMQVEPVNTTVLAGPPTAGAPPALSLSRAPGLIEELVCVGDVHGSPEKLTKLLEKIEAHIGPERLARAHMVFLGDYWYRLARLP